ncbi:MAG: YhfC family intramembrane metalloprotease [Ruminococcus sp.]|nr:YhfC family intramembrane metalloprotease [Ruminococcus sp.]
MKVFEIIRNTILFLCVPVCWWVFLRKKLKADYFPLLVGVISYMMLSLLRGLARVIVLTDGVRENPWLFYFLSAVISAVFEETARLIVFKRLIPSRDTVSDCLAYALGHAEAEVILTTHNFFTDEVTVIDTVGFAEGIAFSSAVSLLVFSAVHAEGLRIGFPMAVLFHVLIDFIPAFYFCGTVSIGVYLLTELLFTVGITIYSYKTYKQTGLI